MTVTTSSPGITAWGPLAEPLHDDAAGPSDPIWKDNAYLSYWDVERRIFGSFHFSTSPNGDGARRARCSLLVGGDEIEIIEPLDRGSYAGESLTFGLDGTITVDHPELQAQFVNAPLHTPADFSLHELIPPLVPGKPLQHFQQACTMRGTIELRGSRVEVDGFGMRDRTWGFRDEAAQWAEYAGLVAVFGDSFLSVMKFLGMDGTLATDGYLIDATGSRHIEDVTFRRTAAAQFLAARFTLEDGQEHTCVMRHRDAGFFVPMGAETEGPAFGTYDDFMTLELDGSPGAGFFEQGIVHRVH
ncbi:hypothetical protein [Gordonia rubripertincta]|uniref:hypothetical protein n=1 Tax=Gordonia rubripertincta TaxID=36822 RepID=UPI000B8D850E|nr:hypothetical protein [Gordonia rubripertincta]ASR01234.1 hypothetical protein GCWB2_02020 [Gordonia rubripertincta]